MDPLFDKVASLFLSSSSVRHVSSSLQISRSKTRKILIMLDLLSSPLILEIKTLKNNGYKDADICEKLKISASTLNENTGYNKGLYNSSNRSKQSLRSERFRIREYIYQERIKKLKEEKRYGK